MEIKYPKIHFAKPLIPLEISNVTGIVLHHIQAKNATVEEIHEWHLANGWSGFAYNEYIRKNGTIYIGRGDFIGSQCKNNNSKTYGIAVEGDYDKELMMPIEQKQSLIERIIYNKSRFKNLIGIFPHSHFNETECPGRFFPMVEILSHLEERKEKQKMFINVDEAIKFLVEEKIINSSDYRKKVCDVVEYENEFVINIANKILELKNQK